MGKLLLISFDAVGDEVLPKLLALPHFAALAKRACLVRGVDSVFLTNTYPVHASVVTGLPQAQHGLVNNTDPFPAKNPPWHADAARLRAKTLWQAAAEKGLESAAVLWPVTAGAKEICYNIPEVLPRPGQSQIAASLAAGSKRLQIGLFLRHRHLLQGIRQPWRDNFAAACTADILRRYAPALTLLHFTAYDSLCHQHGTTSPQLVAALEALDRNLGLVLQAAGEDANVLLFADHAQLNVHTELLPNEWLVREGLMGRREHSWLAGPAGCYFECCGGSCFFHPGTLSDADVQKIQQQAARSTGFGRFLRGEELATCGRARLPLGLAAAPGYSYEALPAGEKANHGYPVDYDHYKVFYLAAGPAFAKGGRLAGGTLLQLAPLAAAALGLGMPQLAPPRAELLATK